MHGHNAKYFEGTEDLTIQRFEQGLLSSEEKAFIASDLIPDLKKNIGDNLIILKPEDTTWEGVRDTIEIQNFLRPLDVIVLDYFALLNTNKAKDKTALINENAYEAKQFVLHDLDNGRGGVALVSPAQGSRKGLDDSKQNDGNWVREGIYMYSELEKSADMIFFTFMDAEMQQTSFMKIGTCKSRRSADVPAQLVYVDHNTHLIGGIGRSGSGADDAASRSNLKNFELASLYDSAE